MKCRALLANWGPVILWAALLFGFSTESFSSSQTSQILEPTLQSLFPAISAHQLEAIHLIIRKLGHWSEYFVFSTLLLRALRHQYNGGSDFGQNALTAGIVFLYALSDELHQAFVPNRTASFGDVLIDLCGGLCAIFWLNLRRKRRKKT
jgi:VanZ family protein